MLKYLEKKKTFAWKEFAGAGTPSYKLRTAGCI
jgi:hypothetical protein